MSFPATFALTATCMNRKLHLCPPEEIPDIVAQSDCRVMLLGGLPVGYRHIWWNFRFQFQGTD